VLCRLFIRLVSVCQLLELLLLCLLHGLFEESSEVSQLNIVFALEKLVSLQKYVDFMVFKRICYGKHVLLKP